MKFTGFPEGKTSFVAIPSQFFSELLPAIQHLSELKLVAYFFWRLEQVEGAFRCLLRSEIAADSSFMAGLAETPDQAEAELDEALRQSIAHGVLLQAVLAEDGEEQAYYFLNSPRGRAAVQAIQSGRWRPDANERPTAHFQPERPNIFALYEKNIGPLTPMIAEALGEAEDIYPGDWIEEAFRIAVDKNKRNWRYISAILQRWQEEGRYGRKKSQDRRDTEEARRKYSEWEN